MSIRRYHDMELVITDIDRRQCHRIVPLKLLVLGLGRTGTDSLRQALRSLGLHDTYHGWAAILENPRDCAMWMEALRAKYDGVGKPYGREEFDRLLGHCQAVSDIPAVVFSEELIRAYPDAKVVLTLRDVDSWYASNLKTMNAIYTHPLFSLSMRLDWIFRTRALYSRPTFQKLWHHFYEGDFKQNGRRIFEEHYARVRKLVPQERLLEYDVSDGWAPLCKFLDVPVPEARFPSGNEVSVFHGRFRSAFRYNMREVIIKFALVAWLVIQAGLIIRLCFHERGTLSSFSRIWN